MNLSQFLQTIDNYTSQMPKDALAVCFHEIARVLPEEQRDWMLSVMERNGAGVFVSEPEAIVPESLYDQLEKIRSGEYRLDSEYNEAWDDWYAEEKPEFVFEDGDGLLDIVDAACAELHRLVECAAFPEAYQLGERLISLDVQTDGDYSDFDKDTLDVEDLEDYELLTASIKTLLLDTACAACFVLSGEERLDKLYELSEVFYTSWTVQELMQHSPEELPDTEHFLTEWIAYLDKIPSATASVFLQEALHLQVDPEQILTIARCSAAVHPEVYAQALSVQMDDAARLSVGLEAMQNISANVILRGEIALQTAEAAMRLGDTQKAQYCQTECFRSDSTPVHYLRALLNSPDYEQSRAELQEIADSVQESEIKVFLPKNHITEETRRFIRFLNGEFQNAYADLQKTYKDYKPLALKQGIALTALFLYPEKPLRQGGQAMCHFLTRELPFDAADYCRGVGTASETDSTLLLWTCLLQCRQHTPLPDREHAVGLLRTLCTNMTDYVMEHNERRVYPECAALAAVLGEILETEGTIPAKNDFLLQCKNLYPRRTAYHRELRTYGMRDGKK